MSSLVAGGLLGLALGVRHTFEPDHLAAVGTFVSKTEHPRRAAAVGALWGAGHASGLLGLGAVVIALRGDMPPWLNGALELWVGAILVVLGVRAMRFAPSTGVEVHEGHAHSHSGIGPFGVGLAHGIAGTGAAVLLATATMPDLWMSVVFLGLFGVGSVFGMAFIAGTVGLPMQRVAHGRVLQRRVLQGSGLLSALIGLWWILGSIAELLPL